MHKDNSRLILGIDTGGTYTDAAICREDSTGLTLVESAKARTTKNNLTIGIRGAVSHLNPELSLEFTFTNATVSPSERAVSNRG